MLGRDVALLSETAITRTENNDHDMVSDVSECNDNVSNVYERELALEICLTSQMFGDIDFDLGTPESDEVQDNVSLCKPGEETTDVIEEEALRYIGGYIVRKFSMRYPHLGKNVNSNIECKTWIDMVNRGQLYTPSNEFYSQLTKMREVFCAVHGDSLREGKDCLKTLFSELKVSCVDLPDDVIRFFAKISVYFRMRHLNREIVTARKENKTYRGMARKRMKLTS